MIVVSLEMSDDPQYRRVKQLVKYYKGKGERLPLLRSIFERIEKHWFEILVSFITLLLICFVKDIVEVEKTDYLVPSLKDIANKQDSIRVEIHNLIEKYKPVEIQIKTLKNSSIFNANEVDSIQIKLYNGTVEVEKSQTDSL